MQLAQFILENLEPVLREWEAFARTILPATSERTPTLLRNNARAMLIGIAQDMQRAQSAAEQQRKSQGRRPRVLPGEDSPAETHAAERLAEGFTVSEVLSEFRALRASIIRLWTAQLGNADRSNLDELTRFNEAIDEALTESVARYALRADRGRNLLLGALGHDLRNPLSAVVYSAQVLQQADSLHTTHAKSAVARIMTCSARIQAMVSDLLDYARMQLGDHMPIAPAPVDLARMCRRIIEEIGVSHPDRSLTFEGKGDLSGRWDPTRIAQMLSNLVGNAVEHGLPNAPVLVTAVGTASEVRLTVHNEGTPIPKDLQRRIFEPLARGAEEQNGSDQGHSVGLGLYIASTIAKAHGGTLELVSSDAAGTTFAARLPRAVESRVPLPTLTSV